MKQIRTILALLLCVCMLPLNMMAAAADDGALKTMTYAPAESGLYAVTVQKDGETLDPLPAKAAIYEPALTVSITENGGAAAQEVDYNVFWLAKGTTYTVQLQKSDETFDASGDWTLSVEKVDVKPLQLNADTLVEGEWFTFTPAEDGSYAIAAAPAPVFVEVMTEGAPSGDWATYALDKEKCRVGMELDYLRSLKAAIALRAEELDLAEDAYNKALNKLDNYNDLIDLANKTGIGGEDSNLGNKKQAVYDALKHILGNNGNLFELGLIRGLFPNLNLPTLDPEVVADMPDNVEAFPDWLSARLQSQNGLVGEAKTKYEDLKAEQAEDQARYDAGLAANPQLAVLIEDTNVETATLRQQVQTDADAILSSASALATDSGMQLVAAKWQNTEDAALTVSLSKDTTYVIHALSNLETSATVTDGTADPDDPDDPPATDKSLLEQLVASASAIDLSKYTDESAAGLQEALAAARETLNSESASPAAITEALKNLRDAIDALVLKEDDPGETVDKSKLEELIAAAEQFKPEDYTDASFGPLQDALESAKAVLENKDASQEDVTNAVNALRDAIAGLKENPTSSIDTSALEEALKNANKIDKNSFTPESVAALATAIAEATALLKNPTDQAAVDAAVQKLNDALNGLVPQEEQQGDEVNKTNLQQLVDMIDKMDRSRFTDESLAALDQAQAEAKRVLADENATQADVDNAIRGLTDAQNGLKLKPATDANREALQKLVDQAEAIDRSKYTDDSLKALDNQIANAKAALDNPSASQTLITLAARRLTAAMNNLQEKDAAEPIHFVDVPDSAYYADAVDWAVRNGVTDGTDATHFSPKADCTRAQIVTFLWRALDKPEPKSNYNPFVDVQPGAYYYEAVLWAIGEGITDGTDATHFSPKDSCTRAHAVTFLWRMENKPGSSITNTGFVDVPAGAYYADAVRWAVANEITNGTDATHFSPKVTCSRAQIVTFLYRDRG